MIDPIKMALTKLLFIAFLLLEHEERVERSEGAKCPARSELLLRAQEGG
jgi:hypothetical protein